MRLPVRGVGLFGAAIVGALLFSGQAYSVASYEASGRATMQVAAPPGVVVSYGDSWWVETHPLRPTGVAPVGVTEWAFGGHDYDAATLWTYAGGFAQGSSVAPSPGGLADVNASSRSRLGLRNTTAGPVTVNITVIVRDYELTGSVSNSRDEYAEASVRFALGKQNIPDAAVFEEIVLIKEATKEDFSASAPAEPSSFSQEGGPMTHTSSITIPAGGLADLLLTADLSGRASSYWGEAVPLRFKGRIAPLRPSGCELAPARNPKILCELKAPTFTARLRLPAFLKPGQGFKVRWTVTPKRKHKGAVVIQATTASGKLLGARGPLKFRGLGKGKPVSRKFRVTAGAQPAATPLSFVARYGKRGKRARAKLTTVLNIPDPKPLPPPFSPPLLPPVLPPAPPPNSQPDLTISKLSPFGFTVTNAGDADAGAFVVSVPGADNGRFYFPDGLPAGTHADRSWTTCVPNEIRATADIDNQVPETDELNNTATLPNLC